MALLSSYEAFRERAAEVHANSFVFDFMPTGEPYIPTPGASEALKQGIATKAPAPQVMRAIADATVADLEADARVRAQVRDVWRQWGVNGMIVTLGGIGMNPSGWDETIRDAAYWHRRARIGDLALCTSADALRHATSDDQVGVVLGTQDTLQIGQDLERIDLLCDLGVRVMQLTYNTRNLVGDGCTERNPAGLSRFGLHVVERFNEVGIIVDASHCGQQTTLDAIEHSSRPVAITHASCQAIAGHPRAKSDEVLRALRDSDGYIGILVLPFFIAPSGGASVDVVAEHVAHAAEIVGVDRVGIGSDWVPDFPQALLTLVRDEMLKHGFSKEQLPSFDVSMAGLDTFSSTEWSNIAAALLAKGFTEDDTSKILGGNWLAFMQRAGL